MPGEIFFQLRPKLANMRSQWVDTDKGSVPASITFLETQLTLEADPLGRFDIYFLLRDECLRAGLTQLEVTYARQCANEASIEPLPWISLADLLGGNEETLSEAVIAASKAVSLAKESNRFVRHALCALARSFWRSDNYPELQTTILALVEDASSEREEDGPFDSDFVRALPPGVIDEALRAKYLNLTSFGTPGAIRN